MTSKERLPLRDYQVKGIKQIMQARRFLLADEPGVAKSRQIIEAFERLNDKDLPILIVVGLKVALGSWELQIRTWSDKTKVVTYQGTPHQRRQIVKKMREDPPNYVLINIAMFKEIFPLFHWAGIAFDEYHKMGLINRKSKTYDTVHKLINNNKRPTQNVVLATGTPISKNPSDLWGPMHLLYPSQFRSYWKFVDEFCTVRTDFQGYKHIEMKPSNPTLLAERIRGKFLRRRLLQVAPEIKEPISTYMPLTLEEPMKSLYKELAEELILQLGNEFVITPNQITSIIRLRQLLVSPQILFEGEDIPLGQMIPAVIELMAEEVDKDKPVVIFTPFRKGVDLIEKEVYKYFNARREACEVYKIQGGGSTESQSVAEEFQTSTHKKKVLIGTIKSAAAYTATTSDIIIFASGEYSGVDMDQASRRILRVGQPGVARFVYLYHRNTVEVKLFRTMRDKLRWADITLSAADLFGDDL